MVKFEKGGLFRYEGDGVCLGVVDEPIRCLRDACEIADGVVLGDIFDWVESWPEVVAFLADYSWCPVEEFHAAARRPVAGEEERDGVIGMEIRRGVELCTLPGYGNSIEVSDEVVLIGEDGEEYSTSFYPVEKMVKLPVRIKRQVKVWRWTDDAGIEDVFIGEATFSLLEVLDALYFDMSFFGGPEETAEAGAEVHRMADEVKSGFVE